MILDNQVQYCPYRPTPYSIWPEHTQTAHICNWNSFSAKWSRIPNQIISEKLSLSVCCSPSFWLNDCGKNEIRIFRFVRIVTVYRLSLSSSVRRLKQSDDFCSRLILYNIQSICVFFFIIYISFCFIAVSSGPHSETSTNWHFTMNEHNNNRKMTQSIVRWMDGLLVSTLCV